MLGKPARDIAIVSIYRLECRRVLLLALIPMTLLLPACRYELRSNDVLSPKYGDHEESDRPKAEDFELIESETEDNTGSESQAY